jgi:hypothetical protein
MPDEVLSNEQIHDLQQEHHDFEDVTLPVVAVTSAHASYLFTADMIHDHHLLMPGVGPYADARFGPTLL